MARQATKAFNDTRAARFANKVKRVRTTEYVVVERDEEFRDGDVVLGGTADAVMVERAL